MPNSAPAATPPERRSPMPRWTPSRSPATTGTATGTAPRAPNPRPAPGRAGYLRLGAPGPHRPGPGAMGPVPHRPARRRRRASTHPPQPRRPGPHHHPAAPLRDHHHRTRRSVDRLRQHHQNRPGPRLATARPGRIPHRTRRAAAQDALRPHRLRQRPRHHLHTETNGLLMHSAKVHSLSAQSGSNRTPASQTAPVVTTPSGQRAAAHGTASGRHGLPEQPTPLPGPCAHDYSRIPRARTANRWNRQLRR
jgi:hypothetical protein